MMKYLVFGYMHMKVNVVPTLLRDDLPFRCVVQREVAVVMAEVGSTLLYDLQGERASAFPPMQTHSYATAQFRIAVMKNNTFHENRHIPRKRTHSMLGFGQELSGSEFSNSSPWLQACIPYNREHIPYREINFGQKQTPFSPSGDLTSLPGSLSE